MLALEKEIQLIKDASEIYDSLVVDPEEGNGVAVELVSSGNSSQSSARAAGVNRSTFHQWVKLSAPTDRAIRRLLRTNMIEKIHVQSRGAYGYRPGHRYRRTPHETRPSVLFRSARRVFTQVSELIH
jgi:hypothetical protein